MAQSKAGNGWEQSAVLVAAALVMGCGVFGLQGSWALRSAQEARVSGRASAGETVALATRWSDMPGIGSAARVLLMRLVVDAAEDIPAPIRLEASRAVLRAQPANGEAWYAAALATIETAGPPGETDALLRQSYVTSPNEARLFYSRIILAVAAWPILAPEQRRSAMHDLDQAQPRFGSEEISNLSALLHAVRPDVRQDIGDTLMDVSHERLRGWFVARTQ